MRLIPLTLGLAVLVSPVAAIESRPSAALMVTDEALLTTVQALGAQVYECKADAAGKLAWQFREPVATLIYNGTTIGRHFAGPRWELNDGSLVAGKVVARAPGATTGDIPHLRLEITSRKQGGQLSPATTILRLNTKGGTIEGACEAAGAMASVPYSADYAFYADFAQFGEKE